MLQETYISDEELEQLLLDPHQPVVFLAPYGGGKTAARQYTQFRWQAAQKKTLIVEYTKEFETVAESLPNCLLQDHIKPLLQAILTAVGQRFKEEPERYKHLYELDQIWWLRMFTAYAAGHINDLLNAHLELAAFISESVAYQKFQSEPQQQPFNKTISFATMLKKMVQQCQHLGFDRVLILVDEIDNYYQNDEVDDMALMLKPLFRTMSTYEHALWKFFVPDDLQSFIASSAAKRKKAIVMQPIYWDQVRLKKMLRHLLMWASSEEIRSLNEIALDDQVLALTDFDEALVETTLNAKAFHKEIGIPRTLLHLGEMLIKTAEKQQHLITKAVWDEFLSQVT
ncbi:MAG: hypothetical protein H6654_10315 [Ardenticatenaceae bacterium]|nr:hypothetical protein [Anaerolineales bacterium]MCB8938705.1 hypothetical protein [Ardenticatenaceae bacterium]MCB8973941.1 hypothetical protein [Ardenticatenaceae bacterium]